ncbi:MAG: hypothetical protein QXQ64_00725 [Candidatus Bathyarchaeia archaeon]
MLKQLSLLILLGCLASMALPAMAQYTTGVKSGDWIKYDFDISYMGMSYKGTIKITIQSVTSTTISGTVELTGNFPGTPPGTSFYIDIATWSGGSFFIVPTNLNVGDYIPGVGATVQAIADWQGRKAYKANTGFTGFPVEVYWDQATGVLLELKGSMSTPYGSATMSIKATDTNMFSLGLGWFLWVIIIVVVVAVVAVVAVILLRRKKPPAAPPSPVQPAPPPPPPPT